MSMPSAGGRGREWAALAALMLGYAALFVVYYPPLSGIEDEVGFVDQALVWSRGSISLEGAGLPLDLPDFVVVNGRHVAVRNPGRSLLALPFLLVGGARATFASGLLLHLALAWGLFERQSWARILGLVLGILALLRFPFGTALGIYTLWVLAPESSAREYDRLSLSGRPIDSARFSTTPR